MNQGARPSWPDHDDLDPLHTPASAPLVGTWDWDIASGRVTWSEALQRLHGLEPGTFGGTFDDHARDIDPRDRERVLSGIDAAVQGSGSSFHNEYLVLRADGTRQPIQSFAEIERDADGRAIRLRGVCMDASLLQESERRRRAEQALSEALFDMADIDEGLDVLTATLGESLQLLFVGYWEIEEGGLQLRGRWVSPAAEGQLMSAQQGLVVGRGESLAGRCVDAGRPIWEEQLSNDVALVPGREAVAAGARSAFSFPIRGRKGVLGAVTGITLEAIQVSQGWEQTLASMSATVAQFVERSSARDELRRRAMQQTAVADFGRFASGHTLEETLEECVRLVQDTLDIEYVKLLRLLPDERHVRMVAGTGWRPEVLAETEPEDIVDSPAGFTLASRSPVIVADLRSETRFGGGTLLTSHSVRSGMSATIGTFDEPWGVLGAYSARQVDFTADDLAFLTTMANTLSAAIERARHDAAQRFLLHASDVLASSTDYRDTLRSLAHLVIDEMADWCAVNLFDEDGSAQTLEVAHRDPAKIEALRAMRTQDLEQRRDGRLATRLLAGESVILPYVSEEALRNFTSDEQRVQALAQLGLQAFVAVPIRVSGRVAGAMLVASAESARRYTKDDVATLEELGRRAGIAIETAQLYEQLRDALRSREDFVSIASHELRSPLTSILGFSRRLHRRAATEGLSESAVEDLATISSEAERMRRTLSLFLEMAGLESGRFVADEVDVDLTDVLVTERDALLRESPEATVQLSCPQSFTVRTDPERVRHIVYNLLSNAVKYGGAPPAVDVVLERLDGRVGVRVRDNGPGIPEEDQAHIFERHYRSKASTSSGKKGLGLGLYISRLIAERLGGSLTFTSVPGEGTEFRLEVPDAP